MIYFKTMVTIAALSLSGLALAETERERCLNVAEFAYRIAIGRDNGVSSAETGAMLKKNARAAGIPKSESSQMNALAGFVYTDLKNKSPDQIKRSFMAECS